MIQPYDYFDLLQRALIQPWSAMTETALQLCDFENNPWRDTPQGRIQIALLETALRLTRSYPKGKFPPADRGQVVVELPFCDLVHLRRCAGPARPRVLFVTALSGHHSTIAGEACAAFLQDHDVFVTDWRDARMVPQSMGRFGFEEYVGYLIRFLEFLGDNTHVIAVSQATVPALTAAAVMAAKRHPQRPRTLSLLAGPVDTGRNPNLLTSMTSLSGTQLLRSVTIMRVPPGYPGKGRRVYPGMLQLFAFLCFDLHSHAYSHAQFFLDQVSRDLEGSRRFKEFYDEFFSVLDITEEFYLETLERVYFDRCLAKGTMRYEGEPVDCGAITDIALMTVEGGEDDICSPGMTRAAHDLCTGLDESLRDHYLLKGAGHFGVFTGSRFRNKIVPRLKAFIRNHH